MTPVSVTEPGSTSLLLARPVAALDAVVGEGGLEALLAILMLEGHAEPTVGALRGSRWGERVRRGLATETPDRAQNTTRGAALLGARLALGADEDKASTFGSSVAREVGRAALPPAVRIHDDERFLLGVAAGVGVAAPAAAESIVAILRARERSRTYRGAALDLWAEALVRGDSRLTADLAERAYRLISDPPDGRPALTDEDRVAIFWLATRTLDALWQPDDVQLAVINRTLDRGRRSVVATATLDDLSPLDAAMVVDAMTWSPSATVTQRNAVDSVLAAIDAFPACAEVLAHRARKKKAFVVADEYDVQDLFHALVRPGVADIVPEDPASIVAGKSSRLDFTSKSARLGFEVKFVRNAAHASTVREEILVDESTYQEHPYVDTVVVFVYDPAQHIALAARRSFENDLSQPVSIRGRTVRYIVRVRS